MAEEAGIGCASADRIEIRGDPVGSLAVRRFVLPPAHIATEAPRFLFRCGEEPHGAEALHRRVALPSLRGVREGLPRAAEGAVAGDRRRAPLHVRPVHPLLLLPGVVPAPGDRDPAGAPRRPVRPGVRAPRGPGGSHGDPHRLPLDGAAARGGAGGVLPRPGRVGACRHRGPPEGRGAAVPRPAPAGRVRHRALRRRAAGRLRRPRGARHRRLVPRPARRERRAANALSAPGAGSAPDGARQHRPGARRRRSWRRWTPGARS